MYLVLRAAQGHQKRLQLAAAILALVEVIANQRHRRSRLRSGEPCLRKTIQPLKALVAADLGLASLGHDPHQFDDVTTLEHQKPFSLLTARPAVPSESYPSSNAASTSCGERPAASIRLLSFLRASCSRL